MGFVKMIETKTTQDNDVELQMAGDIDTNVIDLLLFDFNIKTGLISVFFNVFQPPFIGVSDYPLQ